MIWPKRRQEITGKKSQTIKLNHMKFLILDFWGRESIKEAISYHPTSWYLFCA